MYLKAMSEYFNQPHRKFEINRIFQSSDVNFIGYQRQKLPLGMKDINSKDQPSMLPVFDFDVKTFELATSSKTEHFLRCHSDKKVEINIKMGAPR